MLLLTKVQVQNSLYGNSMQNLLVPVLGKVLGYRHMHVCAYILVYTHMHAHMLRLLRVTADICTVCGCPSFSLAWN